MLPRPGGLESKARQLLGIFAALLRGLPYRQIPDLVVGLAHVVNLVLVVIVSSCRDFSSYRVK